MTTERKTHRGDDGLLYDADEQLVYTGLSPLSEEEDVDPDAEAE